MIFSRYLSPVIATIALAAPICADAQSPRQRPVTHSCADRAMEVYEYDYVDVQPSFPGGNLELIKYINQSRRYPPDAYSRGIEGRVMCSFIVNPDGSISDIRIIKGVEHSLNCEAVRLISEMPRWEAGRVNNEAVAVHCLLPIPFRL